LWDRGRRRGRKRQIRTVPIDLRDFEDLRSRAKEPPEVVQAAALALETLHSLRPAWAELVEYRFWEGLSQKEAADLLGITVRTTSRWYVCARLLLIEEINRILADAASAEGRE